MPMQLFTTLCRPWVEHFIHLSFIVIVAAVVAGAVHVALDLWSKWKLLRHPATREAIDATAPGDILGPLKDLIEALAKAPSWFALFIAGLALVWVAGSQIPQICRAGTEAART